MSVKENLTTALGLIDDGWNKGGIYGTGGYCLLGALAAARTGLRGEDLWDWHWGAHSDNAYRITPEVELVARVAAAEFPWADDEHLVNRVYRFNDSPVTEKKHVIRVLTKAIEAAE